MDALSLITWMQEHSIIMMLIALSFFLLLFGLKTVIFARLQNDEADNNKE